MNFLKKNLFKFTSAAYLFLVSFSLVYADTAVKICDETKKICNPIQSNTIQEVIMKFLEGALKMGIPVVALAVIYCGFLFVEARGNSEKLTKAKEALLYTLIGAAILLGSLVIAQIIKSTVEAF